MKIHHREVNGFRYEEVTVDEIHGTKCERCGAQLGHTFFIWKEGSFMCDDCIDDLVNTPRCGFFTKDELFDKG